MDEDEVTGGSREELQRALYSVDEERTICEYFKRGELWKWDVSPVLLAVATLQTMLKRSVVAGTQVYHHAIQLLKYIHYETPPLGNAKRYVDLLLELKTRAVLYELFEEVEVTEERKQEVLTKFLRHLSEKDAPISVVGHSEDLHTRALSGLQNVLSSQEQFQTFGGENIFDPNNSNKTDTALLKALSRYLSSIRKSLKSLQVKQEDGYENAGDHENMSETESSEEEQAEASEEELAEASEEEQADNDKEQQSEAGGNKQSEAGGNRQAKPSGGKNDATEDKQAENSEEEASEDEHVQIPTSNVPSDTELPSKPSRGHGRPRKREVVSECKQRREETEDATTTNGKRRAKASESKPSKTSEEDASEDEASDDATNDKQAENSEEEASEDERAQKPTSNAEVRTSDTEPPNKSTRGRGRREAVSKRKQREETEDPTTTNPDAEANRTSYNLRSQGRAMRGESTPKRRRTKNKVGWPKGRKRKVGMNELAIGDTPAANTVQENSRFTVGKRVSSRLQSRNFFTARRRRSTRLMSLSISYGIEGRSVMPQLGLIPVKVSPGTVQFHTPAFHNSATNQQPRGGGVRLVSRRHTEMRNERCQGSANGVSGSTEPDYTARLRPRHLKKEEKKERVAGLGAGLEPPPTSRYQLRQMVGGRTPVPDSEATTTSQSEAEEEKKVPRIVRRKRQRSASSQESVRASVDSPEWASSYGKQRKAENGSPPRHTPRPRRVVVFYSSQETTGSGGGSRRRSGGKKAIVEGNRRDEERVSWKEVDTVNNDGGGGEIDNTSEGSPRKSRRKQVTPRRLPVNDSLLAHVLLQSDDDCYTISACEQVENTPSKGARGPNMEGGSTEHQLGAHVLAQATGSSSECEATEDGVFRTRRQCSRTRCHHHHPYRPSHHKPHPHPSSFTHKPHPPFAAHPLPSSHHSSSSTTHPNPPSHHSHPSSHHKSHPHSSTGHHTVVDLADQHMIEQSQPNSQWDYVAVQTVAENTKIKSTALRHSAHHNQQPQHGSTRSRRPAGSETEMSDHDHMSAVTYCSSEEVALAHGHHHMAARGGGGDKLSVVAETSPGSSTPVTPALLSLDVLGRRM